MGGGLSRSDLKHELKVGNRETSQNLASRGNKGFPRRSAESGKVNTLVRLVAEQV